MTPIMRAACNLLKQHASGSRCLASTSLPQVDLANPIHPATLDRLARLQVCGHNHTAAAQQHSGGLDSSSTCHGALLISLTAVHAGEAAAAVAKAQKKLQKLQGIASQAEQAHAGIIVDDEVLQDSRDEGDERSSGPESSSKAATRGGAGASGSEVDRQKGPAAAASSSAVQGARRSTIPACSSSMPAKEGAGLGVSHVSYQRITVSTCTCTKSPARWVWSYHPVLAQTYVRFLATLLCVFFQAHPAKKQQLTASGSPASAA